MHGFRKPEGTTPILVTTLTYMWPVSSMSVLWPILAR